MSHRALTSGSAVVGGSGAGGKDDGRGGNGDDGGGVFMRVFRILPPVAFTLERLFAKNLPKIRATHARSSAPSLSPPAPKTKTIELSVRSLGATARFTDPEVGYKPQSPLKLEYIRQENGTFTDCAFFSQLDYFRIARNTSSIDAKQGAHFLQADFRILIRTFSGRMLAQVCEGVVQWPVRLPARQEAANETQSAVWTAPVQKQ
jgi:hypothetical protein